MAKRAKIVFIGAGSMGFTRSLVCDLLTFDRMRNAELCLVDINRERLKYAERMVRKIVDSDNYAATVTATTDRREVLKGADAVMVTILCGDVNVWQHDILIPKKYGIDINVGDTRGVSGIFRALRTIPTMLDIVRDMEEFCPHAVMLNYTNPMARLCHAMQRTSKVAITGLVDSTYYALITLDVNGTHVEMDSRPSDAIALALRAGAPIYADEEVLEKSKTMAVKDDQERSERIRKWLESLDPEDLGKYEM